jgi:N utilization substance protein A
MGVELIQVLDQLGREKGIDKNIIIEAVEAALLSASRKTFGSNQNLRVAFDEKAGEFKLYVVKTVVAEVVDPKKEISLPEAQKIAPDSQLEGMVEVEAERVGFGRIAAQTAKQVIVQRVREAEREKIYQGFKLREGEMITGVVHRVEKGRLIIDLGKTDAFLLAKEQIPKEHYRQGDRIRAYILEVKKTTKGPQIMLSRTHPQLLMRLFEMEVPEIADGIVEIKGAAREPGERAKIAVHSKDSDVDPVGACVGYRGSRVQAVVRELSGERIDIIPWRLDAAEFCKNALSPAEIASIKMDPATKIVAVMVEDDQLSLAIGKKGQNVRLAHKLLGWKIDIKGRSEIEKKEEQPLALPSVPEPVEEPVKAKVPPAAAVTTPPPAALMAIPGIGEKMARKLQAAGLDSVEKILAGGLEVLSAVPGIGVKTAQKILDKLEESRQQG